MFFLYYHKYFFSPKTFLHQIDSKTKISMVFFIIFFLPYFHLIKYYTNLYIFFIFFFIILSVFFTNSIVRNYILRSIHIFILSYIISLVYFTSINNTHLTNICNKKIYFPYFIKFFSLKENLKFIPLIQFKYYTLLLPKYIEKIFFLILFL